MFIFGKNIDPCLDSELLLSDERQLPLLHLLAEAGPHLLELVPLPAELAGAQVNSPQAKVPQLGAWLDVNQVKLTQTFLQTIAS